MTVKQSDEQNDAVEQDRLAEEAAYLAALAGEDEPDVETPDDSQDDANQDQSDDQHASDQETKDDRIEVVPGYTKEELTEVLASIPQLRKSIDTQNGTYGQKFQAYERTISELKEQLGRANAAPRTALNITPDSFKALKEAGFEELADSLAKDLGGLLPAGNASGDVDAIKREILDQVNGRFEAITQKQFDDSLAALDNQHPDWRDVASFSQTGTGIVRWKNPDFGNWVASQPDDVQIDILESSDPRKIAKFIGEYKESAGQVNRQVEPKTTVRKNVLQKAVTPKGATGTRQLSDKQAEEEAYRRAMAGED